MINNPITPKWSSVPAVASPGLADQALESDVGQGDEDFDGPGAFRNAGRQYHEL